MVDKGPFDWEPCGVSGNRQAQAPLKICRACAAPTVLSVGEDMQIHCLASLGNVLWHLRVPDIVTGKETKTGP